MCRSLFTNQWGKNGLVSTSVCVIVRYPTVLLSALTPCFLGVSWLSCFRESQEFHRVPIFLVKPRALLLAETLCPFICLAAPWGVSRETWVYTLVYHGLFQWWDIMEWYSPVTIQKDVDNPPFVDRSFSEQNHGFSTPIILYILYIYIYLFAGGPYRLFIQSRLNYHIVFIDVVNPLINHGPLNPDLIIWGRQNTTPIHHDHVFLTGNKPYIIYIYVYSI